MANRCRLIASRLAISSCRLLSQYRYKEKSKQAKCSVDATDQFVRDNPWKVLRIAGAALSGACLIDVYCICNEPY